MSDTAQLFILAGIWTLGALVVACFIPKWSVKIVAVALLVGIPFWELPYGYYNFSSLCVTEAHLRVYESIAPQKNVCVEYPFEDAAREILKSGFESVEAKGRSGEVSRLVAESAIKFGASRQEHVTADYCFSTVVNTKLPWRMARHDHLVKRSNDGNVAARQSRFSWAGMWWQEAAAPMLGRGGECSEATTELFKAVRLGTPVRGS